MRYREIKQHHIPAVLSVLLLATVDILAFYISYTITENNILLYANMKYPIRVLVVTILLLYIFKRYNPNPNISRTHESKTIIQLLYFMGIIYIFYKIFSKTIEVDKAQYDLVFLHVFLFLDLLFRIIIRSLQRYFLHLGFGGRNTIIIGKSDDAYHIANEINSNLSLGFKLKGYFDKKSSRIMDRYCNYIGKPDLIQSYIKENNIHEIIIALENHEHKNLLEIIGKYNMFDVCIKIVPDMYEVISGQVRVERIDGIPLLDINPDIMTEFQEVFKRFGDILIALFGILLLLPINVFICILIKINSTGSIFYNQERVGLNGVKFTLIKFRTMYVGSEDITGPVWADVKDPRITAVGKILRKFHLDELPQLLNVLYGNMSIIGPRPERPSIIKKLLIEMPYYSHRFKVKPGITGWAQIMGVYDSNIDDVKRKLKHDFYYIENISLILDFKIILITLIILLKGSGR